MLREKKFIEYPLAENLAQAVAWMRAGNQCWQEISDEWPECGGFDTIEELKEHFPDGLDKTDFVHLVPKIGESTPLFKVGDSVVALTELLPYCYGKDGEDKIRKAQVCYITHIRELDHDQYLFFADVPERYGPWAGRYFALNVAPDE